MEIKDVAELPGDTIAETPAKAEPVSEGDGGANQHLLEAWNHLAMFIGASEDEVEVGQAMALLAQMKILMSGMKVHNPELEDEEEPDPNADAEAPADAEQQERRKRTVKRTATARADLASHTVCYLCEDRAFGTAGGLLTHLKTFHV